ncbi:Phosphatidylinositol 4-phosphate 5-kinase 4 [Hondaea fermentalgiana]|uniref:Phosphatidylinositol 4-phosphate 5-kinase 4 n=1 Tax=Hondaea fermentalgiana TaxID=2315210 RepID=A0A2R5G8D5_9STRA|nr:Phosphatidylinositol 4-phosphate 5-kinase 4 [Hondaea fermentalgiana]|eukprot:GBG24743.1 Phosphatidylinositol 4-phosphate 5-kinase 4 [Hondaea fermentalgiana]
MFAERDTPQQQQADFEQDVAMRVSGMVDTTSAAGLPVEEYKLRRNKHGHGGSVRYLRPARREHKPKKGEITEEHEQYKITYCMMLGIRFSVSRQGLYGPYADPESGRRDLTTDDFMRVDRIVFNPEGSALTPAHNLPSRFLFKDYSQEVFRRLRARFSIDDADYLLSLASSYNYIEFVTNSKSGQFFFYSNDGHYLIKTQTKGESKFLRQVLPQYYMYMMENEDSLLVRICGMHRIKLSHMRHSLHFVILKSVYGNAASRRIHTLYDLKGSTVGRAAKRHEAVYKDLDLINNGQTFKLGPKKAAFMAQLEKDANFLADLHIMDYSLLVGIHNKLAEPSSNRIGTLTGQSSRCLGLERAISRKISQADLVPRSPFRPNGGSTTGVSDAGSMVSRIVEGAVTDENDDAEEDDDGDGDTFSDDATSAVASFTQYPPEDGTLGDDTFDPLPPPDSIFSPTDAVDAEGRQGSEIYYFGIIDILQLYNGRKRTENLLKSIVEGGDAGISSVNPQRYASRFIKFIDAHVE